MIKIYSAASLLDAQLVCDALLDAGMQAVVRGGYLTGAIGELPVETLVNVWLVEPMHYERARKVVASMVSNSVTVEQDVTCVECAALCTNHFSICWNCGASLPCQDYDD